MTKNLAKIGVLLLLCFVATGSSCLTVEKEIDFVLTDTISLTFAESHTGMGGATADYIHVAAEFDAVLAENEAEKSEITEIGIIGVTYEVLDGVSDPPPGRFDDWTISGAIEVWRADGGGANGDSLEAVAYDTIALKAIEGTGPIQATLVGPGIQLINQAIDAYFHPENPEEPEFPELGFATLHAEMVPEPSPEYPLVFTWKATVEFYVVVTREYDVFQLF